MNYLFLDEAERELYEAVAYYEESREGLGREFSREVFATVSRILRFPEHGRHTRIELADAF